jgi:hypothetical protein
MTVYQARHDQMSRGVYEFDIIVYATGGGATLTVENTTITGNLANVGSALHSFGPGIETVTFNNSIVDGTVVRLNIPPLTEERRKDLVKIVHKRMEEARVEIRNIRRDANDHLKKEERDGTVGADEGHRQIDVLQKTTDRHIAEVDRRGGAKEQEVLEV